jgi:outer membrane protein assembly factor BamB
VGERIFTMDEVPAPEKPGTAVRQEAVVCLDAKTGKQLWRFQYPSPLGRSLGDFGSAPRSTPAVDGNFVYAVGATGIFHCLRADTGEKVWRHDLLEQFHEPTKRGLGNVLGRYYGVSFSPLVEENIVYTTPGGPNGNSLAAFDKHNGKLVWKALDDPAGHSSPIAVTIAGVRQVIFLTNAALVSLSPKEGRLNWRYPWIPGDGNGFNIATPIAFGDYIFISTGFDKGCALLEITAEADHLQASRVYEHNRMRNHVATSVRLGDYLYGFDKTDLVCMAVRTGSIVWREKGYRAFGEQASLLLADGNLIIMGEHGTLYLASATPAGYQQKSSFQVSRSKKCWTVPALAGGKLYVRDDSQIVCLDLRSQPGGELMSGDQKRGQDTLDAVHSSK